MLDFASFRTVSAASERGCVPSTASALQPWLVRSRRVRTMSGLLLLAWSVAATPSVGAQNTSQSDVRAKTLTSARIVGVVFDSLAGQPLHGAKVQLVWEGNRAAIRTADAGSDGRFLFDSVPGGQYRIGFEHPKLDLLLIRSLTLDLAVSDSLVTSVELFIPSGKSLVQWHCGISAAHSAGGLILGNIQSVIPHRGPLTDVQVVARWRELALGASALEGVGDSAVAHVGGQSAFVLCGLPRRSQIELQVSQARRGLLSVAVDLPENGVLVRDWFVPALATLPTAEADPAQLTGTVVDSGGHGVPNARVQVHGRDGFALTDASGRFGLSTYFGTQSISVRALGFSPRQLMVDVLRSPVSSVDVVLSRPPTTLRAMTIRDRRSFAGFEMRRVRGAGVFIDEETIQRRKPWVVGDVLMFVPGVRVESDGTFSKRFETRFGRRSCEPTVYVNGREMLNKSRDLDAFVDVQKIRAVEVYSVPGEVPAEFAADPRCGAVVIWTHQ